MFLGYNKCKQLVIAAILCTPSFVTSQIIDSTFGVNGFLPYGGSSSNDELNEGIGYSSVVQPDGKIVATIDKADLNGPSDLFFYTYRYNEDGTPDSTFGLNGVSRVMVGDHSRGYDIQLQADGKIVVTGESKYCVNGICGASQLVLFRLKTNGDADSTFGTDGKIITSDIFGASGTFAIPKKVNLLDNGKIILGGRGINGKPFIARLNTNGYPDPTFATNGVYTVDVAYSQTMDVKVDQNGNSYGLINVFNYIGVDIDQSNPADILIVKLDSNGQPDLSFGTNGNLNLNLVPDDQAASFALLSDESIAIIGRSWMTIVDQFGSITSDFPGGYHVLNLPTADPASFQKILAINDNNFLICGSLNPMFNGNYHEKGLIVHVNESGELMTTFNDTGMMSFDYGMLTSFGWQGKFAIFFDVDYLTDGTVYATGKRNPIAGNTRSGVFLLKIADLEIDNGSLDLSDNDGTVSKTLIVYPNPATEEIHFKLPYLEMEDLLTWKIFASSGSLLLGGRLNSTDEFFSVSIEGLQSGTYFIQLETTRTTHFRPFVKL